MKKTLTIITTAALLVGCQPEDTTIQEPSGAARQDSYRMTNDTNEALQPDQSTPSATNEIQSAPSQTP